MGMVFDEVTFDGRGPTVDELAAKITEICGLPVNVQAPGPGDLDIYDQHAYLSFTATPEEQLEVISYRPGAAKKFYNDFMEGFEDLPTAKYAVGLNEPPGMQIVHLRSFVGHEPTLMMATVLALEALGGRPRSPITDDIRREYGTPITEVQLAERRKKLHDEFRRAAWIGMLMLPITIPLFMFSLLVRLVLLPWQIGMAVRGYREIEEKREHREFMKCIPNRIEFVATTPDAFDQIDRPSLKYYTESLEELGFILALDYEAKMDIPSAGRGFARLLIHPVHQCIAEINQLFPDGRPELPVRCMIGSLMSDDWDLTTTDRTLFPLNYAWRRPRGLWIIETQMTPDELLAEHLARRQRMIDHLHICVVTDLTAEAYFAREHHILSERRTILQQKTMATINAEMTQFEKTPISEWLGDFATHELAESRN